MRFAWIGVTACVLAVALPAASRADDKVARKLTDYGPALMAAAVVLENETPEGRKKGLLSHAIDEALVTGAATELLKVTVRERRPNGGNHGSFPSGHASFSFGLATVLAKDKPGQKWVWYLTAAAISWSRVALRAHHTHDVVAGALLGHFLANETLAYDRRHGGSFSVKLWHRDF